MTNKEIITAITNPLSINKDNVTKIKLILNEYPYFQSAQTLLTIGLLNTNSNHYNLQLKKAASYSINRYKLFNLINNKKRQNNLENISKDNLNIGKPLEFNTNEIHSFSEWLSLSNIKKIKRTDNKKQVDIINKFISNKQTNKDVKDDFFNPSVIAKESLVNNTDIVTPTLAKVYLEQGHYEKAISAYKVLSLRYPEKISLFADRIKLIEKLKKQ